MSLYRQNGGLIGPPIDVNGDPYWDSCVLALRCDGANGSTTFTDLSPAARGNATVNGNAQVSTAQSKFYGSSLALDGTGDFLSYADSADLDFGARDFTLYAWVYHTTAGVANVFRKSGTSGDFAWQLTMSASTYSLDISSSGSGFAFSLSFGAVATGTWQQVVATRSGSQFTGYVNGVAAATTTNSLTIYDAPTTLCIGNNAAGSAGINGYMNDAQVYTGVAIPASEIARRYAQQRPFMARRYPSGMFTL